MKFDELLKRHNESTELMKFVDDDPYKKYDNIVDAYHDAKQFRPDDVEGITAYKKLLDTLSSTKVNFDGVLNDIYVKYPNSNLTNDKFYKSTTLPLKNGNVASVYDMAMKKGLQVIPNQAIGRFVNQYNELAKRVRKQTSKQANDQASE